MKFKAQICILNDESRNWWEDFDNDEVTDALVWCEELVRDFNHLAGTQREHRKLLQVEIIGSSSRTYKEYEEYEVILNASATASRTIIVKATSEEEANEKAIKLAMSEHGTYNTYNWELEEVDHDSVQVVW